MTITASIALNPSTVTAGQKATATLTISNSLSTAVNIENVTPTAPRGAPVLLGQPPTGPSMPMTVPATGTDRTMTFDVVPIAPEQTTYATNPFGQGSYPGGATITPLPSLAQPSQQVIAIGAMVYTADGSATTASTANLTINGPVVG